MSEKTIGIEFICQFPSRMSEAYFLTVVGLRWRLWLLLGGCELFRYHFIGHTCAPSSLWLPLFRWLVVWLDARRADEPLEGETA